jgi:2-succinyl-6-hydroxy-2,4-cyclohexadiene-1-carboxylate synthase
VDLPGHGRSAPDALDLWATGRSLVRSAPSSVLLGYSLGGRVALHAALADPAAVERLVLIGAHPGIENPEDRRRRRAEDEARAVRLERIGTAAFVDEWLALPLFAGLDHARGHHRQRLDNDARGLAGALRSLGTGTQEPLWGRLEEFGAPVLVLAGERDGRFVEIGERTAGAIGENATFTVVPGVGHAVQLEDPEATAAIVIDWLTGLG